MLKLKKGSLQKTGQCFLKIKTFEERNKLMHLKCWEFEVGVGLNIISDFVYFVLICIVLTCIGLPVKQREVTCQIW